MYDCRAIHMQVPGLPKYIKVVLFCTSVSNTRRLATSAYSGRRDFNSDRCQDHVIKAVITAPDSTQLESWIVLSWALWSRLKRAYWVELACQLALVVMPANVRLTVGSVMTSGNKLHGIGKFFRDPGSWDPINIPIDVTFIFTFMCTHAFTEISLLCYRKISYFTLTNGKWKVLREKSLYCIYCYTSAVNICGVFSCLLIYTEIQKQNFICYIMWIINIWTACI